MVCEGNSKAQVWFRYGTNDWTVFKSNSTPVSTTCTVQQGQTPEIFYRARFKYRIGDGTPDTAACNIIKDGYTDPVYKAPFNSWNFRLYYRTWYLDTFYNGQQTFSYQPYGENEKPLTYVDPGSCPSSPIADWANTVYPETVIWERVDGQIDPSITVFQILDATGTPLYQKTASICPEVQIICGNGCPPETVCQCETRERICCYDANGYVIEQYLKAI
jgi:hypothetical protein